MIIDLSGARQPDNAIFMCNVTFLFVGVDDLVIPIFELARVRRQLM